MSTYEENYDNFLNVDSLTGDQINSINADSKVADGSLTTAKISNLNVDTINVSTTGYIRSGKTSFTDSTNGGWYQSAEGIYYGSASDATKFKYDIGAGTIDFIGTISSKSTADVAAAFGTGANAQNIITDIVNARISTSSKEILSDFNFGSTNYAGAVKAGDVTWNSTTGAITSGSGIIVYRGGIVGAKNGVATFTITTAGDATFAGTLSAAAGTLGTITAGTFNGVTVTGGTVQTSSSANTGVKMTTGGIDVYGETLSLRDTSGNLRGYLGSSSTQVYFIGVSGKQVKVGSYLDFIVDTPASYGIIPVNSNQCSIGNSSYYWADVYSSYYDFGSSGHYITYDSTNGVSTSTKMKINGTLNCGQITSTQTAITLGSYTFYVYDDPDASGKYYLRTF